MSVNWGVNGFIGLTASLVTYFFSYSNNTWQTSLFRAGMGFFLFFVLGFILQFVVHQVDSINSTDWDQKQNSEDEIELKTGSIIHHEEFPIEEQSFQAFSIDALQSAGNLKDPEITVDTIRNWN